MRLTRRTGFTLVELMVTMSIAVLLIAIALPLVKFSIEEGRTREASRQLNAFLSRAKAQAAATGRPHGVWFDRDLVDSTRCVACYLAEIPPVFGGALQNSTVKITPNMTTPTQPTLQFYYGASTPDTTSPALLKTLFNSQQATFGIRFDFKGPIYVGYFDGSASFNLDTSGNNPKLSNSFDLSRNLPYQIYRLPQKISHISFELPKGTYISLTASGLGANGNEFSLYDNTKNRPIVLMFSPSGALSSVSTDVQIVDPMTMSTSYQYVTQLANSTVHLLVARLRTEAVQPPILSDASNYWVSIGHLTGNIATSEMGYDIDGDTTVNLPESRFYAVRYDQAGGR